MLIKKQQGFSLVYFDEKEHAVFTSQQFDVIKNSVNENVVFDIHGVMVNEDILKLIVQLAQQFKENGTSFVVVSSELAADELPEEVNLVPTLVEAADIIEMENIERELGF